MSADTDEKPIRSIVRKKCSDVPMTVALIAIACNAIDAAKDLAPG